MTQFLCKLQNDMYSSQLGALLHQKNRLSTEMLRESPQFKANTDLLNNFEVYLCVRDTSYKCHIIHAGLPEYESFH